MRALHLVVIGAVLAIPSVGYSQADGPVGGKVGPNLESPSTAQPGASLGTQPYGARPPGAAAGTRRLRGRRIARASRAA